MWPQKYTRELTPELVTAYDAMRWACQWEKALIPEQRELWKENRVGHGRSYRDEYICLQILNWKKGNRTMPHRSKSCDLWIEPDHGNVSPLIWYAPGTWSQTVPYWPLIVPDLGRHSPYTTMTRRPHRKHCRSEILWNWNVIYPGSYWYVGQIHFWGVTSDGQTPDEKARVAGGMNASGILPGDWIAWYEFKDNIYPWSECYRVSAWMRVGANIVTPPTT
jgi:hypothetical protein